MEDEKSLLLVTGYFILSFFLHLIHQKISSVDEIWSISVPDEPSMSHVVLVHTDCVIFIFFYARATQSPGIL